MADSYQYYQLYTRLIEDAIVRAIPHVYAAALSSALHGSTTNARIAGLLIIFGTSIMMLKGLWKFILKDLARSVLSHL